MIKWLTLFLGLFILARKVDMKFNREFLADKKIGEVFQHNGHSWMKVNEEYAARMLNAKEWTNGGVLH